MDSALQAQLDRNYRYQRYVYDLTREYYLLGRDRLIDELQLRDGAALLEMGCGTARNLLHVAEKYPGASCFGVDLSAAMLETARANVARKRRDGLIKLAHGDATSFDPQQEFGRATFDRVIFSYALSMIPRWDDALRHATSLVAPAGRLHIVDFGDGAGLPATANKVLRNWLRQFHVTPRNALPEVMAELARTLGAKLTVETPFRSYCVLATLSLPGAAR